MESFLKQAKALLPTGNYTIKRSEKNIVFERQFNLRDKQKKDILLSLTAEDCIAVEPNNNPRYADCEVYKFIKLCDLFVYGQNELVPLYIKMYIQEEKYDEMIIVISFHEEGMHD